MARRLLPIGITLAVLAAAAYGTWAWLAARHQVSTEDAYVEGAVVVISARVPGPVASVHVRDNEDVRAGQLLVEIDPRDSQIRVEQERAAVAMATAEARGARSEVPLARESTESRLQQARIAVTTTWLSRQTQVHMATLIGHVTPWSAATADRLARLQDVYLAAGADADTARHQALRHLYEEVQRQASMNAFADDFLRLAALFVVMVPLVWVMRRPSDAPRPQPVEAV